MGFLDDHVKIIHVQLPPPPCPSWTGKRVFGEHTAHVECVTCGQAFPNDLDNTGSLPLHYPPKKD